MSALPIVLVLLAMVAVLGYEVRESRSIRDHLMKQLTEARDENWVLADRYVPEVATDAELVEDFHEAGIYLKSEREQYEADVRARLEQEFRDRQEHMMRNIQILQNGMAGSARHAQAMLRADLARSRAQQEMQLRYTFRDAFKGSGT